MFNNLILSSVTTQGNININHHLQKIQPLVINSIPTINKVIDKDELSNLLDRYSTKETESETEMETEMEIKREVETNK